MDRRVAGHSIDWEFRSCGACSPALPLRHRECEKEKGEGVGLSSSFGIETVSKREGKMTRGWILMLVLFLLIVFPFTPSGSLWARGDDGFVITLPVGHGVDSTITADPTDEFYKGPEVDIGTVHHPVWKKKEWFPGFKESFRREDD